MCTYAYTLTHTEQYRINIKSSSIKSRICLYKEACNIAPSNSWIIISTGTADYCA